MVSIWSMLFMRSKTIVTISNVFKDDATIITPSIAKDMVVIINMAKRVSL
jgi:hypothetical protein